jgi:acyl-CoA thioesterase
MKKGLTAARSRRIQQAAASVPFARLLGIELVDIRPGSAELSFEIREDLMQNNGVVHGGAIASLIDTAMAFAIISVLSPKEKVTTVDLTVNYLRPLIKGKVSAIAKVVKAGRSIIVVSAEVFDAAGNLANTSLSNYIRI